MDAEIEFTLSISKMAATRGLFEVNAISSLEQKGERPEHDTQNS
jgi:hypothetical protein